MCGIACIIELSKSDIHTNMVNKMCNKSHPLLGLTFLELTTNEGKRISCLT